MSKSIKTVLSSVKSIALGFVASAALAPAAFGISLTGETVNIDYVTETGAGQETHASFQRVVGNGYEAAFFDLLKVNITDDIVDVYSTGYGTFHQMDFSGVVISDAFDAIDTFTSFEQLDGATFNNISSSFDGETLYIDFGDAGTFLCGDHISFRIGSDVLPTPPGGSIPGVPIPGTLPLMLGGLALLGWRGTSKTK